MRVPNGAIIDKWKALPKLEFYSHLARFFSFKRYKGRGYTSTNEWLFFLSNLLVQVGPKRPEKKRQAVVFVLASTFCCILTVRKATLRLLTNALPLRKIELTSGNPGLFYVFSRTAISLDDHFVHSVSDTGKANDSRVCCHHGKMGSKDIHATRLELLPVNLTEEIRVP